MKEYLNEAFQKLELLESEDFNLYDQDAFDDLKSFKDEDASTDILNIIDDEAETEEELKDSYIGKVILECNVCHSLIFKSRDELDFSEDGSCVNEGEECPVCFSNDGFSIVGQVEPYEEVEVTITDKDEEPTEDANEESKAESEDEKDEDKEEKNESLTESAEEEEIEEKCDESCVACEECEKTESCDESLEESELSEMSRPRGSKNTRYYYHDKVRFTPSKASSTDPEWLGLKGHTGEVVKIYGDYTGGRDRWVDMFDVKDSETGKVWTCGRADIKKLEGIDNLSDDAKEIYNRLEQETANESLKEDLNNIELDTENQHIEIKSTPKEDNPDAEMVAPVDQETIDDLMAEGEEDEAPEEELATDEDEMVDYPVDEFDEESFDELGESYLKKVYENVNSYKTTKITEKNDKIFVEGVINFKSGNSKKTSFIFEAKDADRNQRVRFIGENAQITRGRKAFTVAGNINNGKFISESLNYNYRQKNTDGQSSRVYGTIRTK